MEKISVEQEIQELWETFWKPLVTKDGELDLEQIKKELYDFHFIMQQVPKVYTHITGNKLSKLMYRAETVIRMADEYYEDLYETNEAGGESSKCLVWLDKLKQAQEQSRKREEVFPKVTLLAGQDRGEPNE